MFSTRRLTWRPHLRDQFQHRRPRLQRLHPERVIQRGAADMPPAAKLVQVGELAGQRRQQSVTLLGSEPAAAAPRFREEWWTSSDPTTVRPRMRNSGPPSIATLDTLGTPKRDKESGEPTGELTKVVPRAALVRRGGVGADRPRGRGPVAAVRSLVPHRRRPKPVPTPDNNLRPGQGPTADPPRTTRVGVAPGFRWDGTCGGRRPASSDGPLGCRPR